MQISQRVRQFTKLTIASVLEYTGMMRLVRSRLMSNKAAILMYHRVVDRDEARFDYAPNGMVVTTAVFEKHIRYLSRHYHTVTINELCDYLEGKKHYPKKPLIAVTFDDGWLDNWTNAIPILNKYNVPATIFIGCNFIENKDWYWLERVKFVLAHTYKSLVSGLLSKDQQDKLLSGLKNLELDGLVKLPVASLGLYLNQVTSRLQNLSDNEKQQSLGSIENIASLICLDEKDYFMSWEQVKLLPEYGIEVGAHTITHTDLTTLNNEQIVAEIINSKIILESKLSSQINNFAFPYGKNNIEIQKIVESSGFRSACSTINGLVDDKTNIFLLNRINMHTDVSITPSMFAYRILAL